MLGNMMSKDNDFNHRSGKSGIFLSTHLFTPPRFYCVTKRGFKFIFVFHLKIHSDLFMLIFKGVEL